MSNWGLVAFGSEGVPAVAVSMRPSEHAGSDDLVIDGTPVEGFDELYEAYAPRVKGLIRRLIADPDLAADVLQETFLRAFRSDIHRETGEDQWPWLATVARNICLDALRKRSRISERDQLDEAVLTMPLVETHGDPEWHFKANGRREGIADALASVSPRCRRILLRKHLDGWCYDQIAESEGMSVEAVKSALARARRSFRESYAAIAEHRGLGAALGGALASLRARLQTARHRLAERMSLSAQYVPHPAAFGDALAAAFVAGAVAVSAGMASGAVPSVPLDKPEAVHEVAAASTDDALDTTAGEETAPASAADPPAEAPSAPSATGDPVAPEGPGSQPRINLDPPDPNQHHSVSTDDHVPGDDEPGSVLVDLEAMHEDDGMTGVNNDDEVDVGDRDNLVDANSYGVGVDCSPEVQEGSMTATAVCGAIHPA